MTFTKQPPSIEEAKLLSERMERHDQLKARLKQTRDRLTSAGTTGAEKLELQELLIGIETEMAAFVAEASPDVVDPFKVVEDAAAIGQQKEDERKEAEAAQNKTLAEMREMERQGIAY